MQLKPKGRLRLNNFRGSYPLQLQPTISVPDYAITAVMGNAADLQGIVCDPIAGCVYARPIFVPHNQLIRDDQQGVRPLVDINEYVDPALPAWEWEEVLFNGASIKGQFFQAKHWGHQTLDWVWNSEASPTNNSIELRKVLIPEDEEDVDEQCQGFLVFLSRSIYNRVENGADCHYDVQFDVGGLLYSVKVSSAEYAQFRVSSNGGTTWKVIAGHMKMSNQVTQAMGTSSPARGQQPIVVEVLLVNKSLQIKFGGQAVPYHYLVDGLVTPAIREVRVKAKTFTQFNAEVHPLKFATTAALRSNLLPLGFSPANTPYYYIGGLTGLVARQSGVPWLLLFPAGSSISVTRVGLASAIEHQYDLVISNPQEGTYQGVPYSRQTAACTRVVVQVDGIWSSAFTNPVNVVPKRITETVRFDPVALAIDQHFSATLDNIHGQWGGQAGNIAVQLELGYAAPPTVFFPRFTGMCGNYNFRRPAANVSVVDFECDTLMGTFDVPIFAPPVMDGWNHYYAVAYLAQFAGWTLSQMAFAPLVPSDPFTFTGFDPEPYFLPFGEGMRPWTPRNREGTVRELMDYVRKPTGFLLYVDAQGYLRYEKWIPPFAAPVKRIFTNPTGVDGEGLTEIFDFELLSTIDDVRNQVLLIGLDPFDPRWSLTLTKLEDTFSIFAAPGFEPVNYVGFKRPFVWVDPRFANGIFTATAAVRLFELLRLPGLHARFTGWMQPDIYPMDVVFVLEGTSGAAGVPFYVLDTHTHWSYEGYRQSCLTTISGKFLV